MTTTTLFKALFDDRVSLGRMHYSSREQNTFSFLQLGNLNMPCCWSKLYQRLYGAAAALLVLMYQAAADLLEHLGDRHWMYPAALSSLAQCHEAKQDYDTAITLLEQALELRRQLFSTGSYLYADTASHLAVVLLKRNAAAAGSSEADGSSSSSSPGSSGGGSSQTGSGAGSWFGFLSRDGGSAGGGVVSNDDVRRAIDLLQHAVKVVEDAGEETRVA